MNINQTDKSSPALEWSRGWLLLPAALGWGIAAGLIEAAGLLIFQRLNWARWGPVMHVSKEIFDFTNRRCHFLLAVALICRIVVGFASVLRPAYRRSG